MNDYLLPRLLPDTWSVDTHFSGLPIAPSELETVPGIVEARRHVANANVAEHPFFRIAETDFEALREWVRQETVITNYFSQIMMIALANIENVNIRSLVFPAVGGEHGRLKDGHAPLAHPNLLWKMVHDLGIDPASIAPRAFTVRYAEDLLPATRDPLYGLGLYGIGNETLLGPEYAAVESAFAKYVDEDIYRPFLRANIEEDKAHADIMEIAAACLIAAGADPARYDAGAEAGVAGRMRYYDGLAELFSGT